VQPDAEALYSLNAEMSVIGGLILEPERFETLVGVVNMEFFHRPAHRILFETLRALHDEGSVLDTVTVVNALRTAGNLEKAGGVGYLSQLMSAVPSAAHIEHHARIVREKAHLRKLQTLGRELAALATSGKTAVEVQEEAERWVYAAGEGVQVDAPIVHIGTGLNEALARLDKNEPDVLTGFTDFDRMSQGFARGDLVILAARPSMGKTSLALQMALNVTLGEKKPVPVFSLEMTREAISRRLMFTEARVDIANFRRHPTRDEYDRLAQAVSIIHGSKLYVHCTAKTAREVRAQCRRVVAKDGALAAVVIDYLGKMRGSGNAEKRVHELGEITGDLKAMAVEFDCPVLLLCQLSRAVEARPDRKPMLSDLRDSGEIEQDADTVLLLYRPEYYFGPTMKAGKKDEVVSIEGKAELIVAKQRNGETGSVPLVFLKHFTRFENMYSEGR
jgi:replicative DNA helicase